MTNAVIEAPLDPDSDRYRRFVLANTTPQAPPHVPEIKLHLADEAHDLWLRTEAELAMIGLPPPFWAFAWAGGQGLARYLLDHRTIVADRSVLDFASGSGLVGIAAALAGATHITACDIDPFARPAITLNADENHVSLSIEIGDLIDSDAAWDVVLAGDVFYEAPLADRLVPWLTALANRGAIVIVGDPGRSYLPKNLLEPLAVYSVPVTRILEDAEVKQTTVWRWRG